MRIIGGESVRSNPYLWLPDGWDAGWKAAKAAQGSAPAWVGFIGDSITQGFNCSDQMTKSFAQLIRAGLLAGDTPYGDFYNPNYTTGTNPPFTIVNGGAGNGGFGAQNQSSNLAIQVTIQSPYPCTQIDLWVKQTVAGSWKYAVDGGAQTTVNNVTSNFFVTRTPLAIGTGSHSVVLGTQSVANALCFCGASFFPNSIGGTGLGFAFSGVNGIALASFNPAFGLQEGWVGRNAHLGAFYAPLFPQAPHLIILGLGVNDCNTQACSPETYQRFLMSFVQQFQRGRVGCSVLLLVPCYPDTDSSDTTNTLVNQHAWPRYIDAMYSVARSLNCGLVNIHAKWGQTPQTQGFIAAGSNVHPSDAGHADIANTVLGII